jgi:hypothetical protein
MIKHHEELNELKNKMQTLLFVRDNNNESSLIGLKIASLTTLNDIDEVKLNHCDFKHHTELINEQ